MTPAGALEIGPEGTRFIRFRPLAPLFGMGAIGLAIGWLLGRRRRSVDEDPPSPARRDADVVWHLEGLMTRAVHRAILVVLAIAAPGCVFHRVEVQPVNPAERLSFVGPLKAHLRDGSTVVYASGVVVTVTGQTLRGTGMRYSLAPIEAAVEVESVPLETIVAMERFETKVNRPASIAASIAGSYAVAMSILLVMLAVALEGH